MGWWYLIPIAFVVLALFVAISGSRARSRRSMHTSNIFLKLFMVISFVGGFASVLIALVALVNEFTPIEQFTWATMEFALVIIGSNLVAFIALIIADGVLDRHLNPATHRMILVPREQEQIEQGEQT